MFTMWKAGNTIDATQTIKFGVGSVGKIKVPIAASRTMFVYEIQVNPIYTILKYGIYYEVIDR